MKALKSVLLIVALLSLLIVAGCQEGYNSQNYSPDNFAWEQGATGFWQPNVTYTHDIDSEYELSRR
ncbi:MAG: hypothetical protein RQ760_15765 [Sedimentisphaerales bacterium]|nr:hypothetical protein [Sedimentisphaerales bacterium]